MSERQPLKGRRCIIIDAGHGGEDGGAISCTGAYESNINLEIASKLNDFLHFLGYQTMMTRTEDNSLHTTGNTIAARKVSDLRNRVAIVNSTKSALLVSIHQNSFPESKYNGPQVFYNSIASSKNLAESIQSKLIDALAPDCSRRAKAAQGIYLMDHAQCEGVLVECGFLSNPTEETRLRSNEYQKQVCIVIGCVLSSYMST